MTNGEMIQKVFKGCEVCEPILEEDIIHVVFPDKNDSAIGFDWSWWNMEYKEPTTKNDLGVDAVSREAVLDLIADYDLSMGQVVRGIHALPPVTPQEPRWILDSERCPEKTGRYLITYYNRYQDTTETQEAFFVEEDDEFKWYDTTEIEITLAVIAWMPLPTPYEPQESEDV